MSIRKNLIILIELEPFDLSELIPIMFNMELTHLGLKASNQIEKQILNDEYMKILCTKINRTNKNQFA